MELFDATPGKIRFKTGEGLIHFVFECEIDPTAKIILSEEHASFTWLPKEEAAQVLRRKFSDELVEKVENLNVS